MKASRMLISTLKETPNEAVISSHILLLRAGMIRKLVAGVYNYLPLGLRTLTKIENIIREEMDKAGGLEILSSAMQPKELWEESGRWQKYGPELMRFKDRHDREFCLGPTHEEIFTDLVRNQIRSKKNLPINIYQIQTKYRDEFRPRFGLMRGREFIMKDAYSFDTSYEGLDESYKIMHQTYCNIFDRLNLKYQIVLADTGAIGGSGSHQFMALSDIGESDIIYCSTCKYAADQEKAESNPSLVNYNDSMLDVEEVETINKKTIEEVSSYLEVESNRVVKSIVYKNLVDDSLVVVLVRGDKDVNEIKVINELNIAEHELVLASYDDILTINSVEGFVGPVNLKDVRILVDEEVTLLRNFVVGANKKNYHLKNVNYKRDFEGTVGQFRKTIENDICPICGQPLSLERGIEVGQIFKLGTKYSEPMNCTFQDDDGKVKPMVMGCYGIGVTRTMSAIIEQNHDDFGIIWPLNVAPYHSVIVPINYQDEAMKELSDKIHDELVSAKVEVVLDDRSAKAGFKFKDWELIGIPYQIVVGKRASEGIVEFKDRRTLEKTEMPYKEAIELIVNKVREL
ncbi:MAG: proline--tRNA ligase [Erysipelotrichaceae bacterium]|nr:proline--tRNA ligase [Erysipelotrichaceae bacterium]